MNEMHRAGVRRRVLIVMVTVLMAPLTFLGATASSAVAAPRGIFAAFAQCPTHIPGVRLCQYVEITSGELVIGSMTIPIDKTVVIQGGAIPTGSSNFNEYFALPAVNGESVSLTELSVPGGLRTVIGCQDLRDKDSHRAFRRWRWGLCSGRGRSSSDEEDGANGVAAIVEPVASPSNPSVLDLAALVEEKGTVLRFPARIHLKNRLLGEACYIGSPGDPIELLLTDGTTSPPPPNQPITGKIGTPASELEEGYEALTATDDTLVDNAFSAPPAEGCGGELSSLINPLVNQAIGLESTPGHNTAILTGTHKIAEAGAVLASETFPTKQEEENTNPPPPHHHHHHHWWSTAD